jgi:drug/metabolite transporter (DMT)-like permease
MKQSFDIKQIIGSTYVLIGAVMFAGKAVIVKWLYIHSEVNTISLLALRMLFSLPFYIGILVWNKSKTESISKLSQKEWLAMLGIGLVGYYLASLFDFWGLFYISASLERLVLFIYPTLVVIISAIFFKKRIKNIQIFALIITYLGIIVAFIPEFQIGMQKNMALGSFLIFMSAFTYAIYLIGNGEMVKRIGTTLFTCYAMIISTIMIIIHYVVHTNLILKKGAFEIFHFQAKVYWLSLVMAVFCTVIPSFLISDGIKRIGSSNGAIIGSVGPVATIFMATYFLGESFNNWQIAGTVLILVGVLMISVKK